MGHHNKASASVLKASFAVNPFRGASWQLGRTKLPTAGAYSALATGKNVAGLTYRRERGDSYLELLADGRWRERRLSGKYWPLYLRRHRGNMQKIYHVAAGCNSRSGWQLTVNGSSISFGDLGFVLQQAQKL